MKNLFSSHFTDDDQRREKLWENCIFVFDTNVLTSVYKRSDDARDALYKVISSLGDRIWIPYQVVHELLDNRATIVHAQAGLYGTAIENLNAVLANFESATKHPFLPKPLHAEFLEVSQKVIAELQAKREFHDARLTSDEIKIAFSEMLDGKIGQRYTEEQLKSIIKEGELRYANKVPPGFEDVNKHKGSTIFSEVCKRYGDLIIWKQIIEKAKALDKPVILVTGEQKDDWWARHGGKTIGPLPGLIEEFTDAVGQDFFLYSHHHFLELANTYLEQNTSSEVIDEVRDAALDDSEDWMLRTDEGLNNHVWSSADPSFLQIKEYLEGRADSDPLTFEFLKAQQSLLHLRKRLENSKGGSTTSGRLPNDPREVRRRKREAALIADLEGKILSEIQRLQILNSSRDDE